MGKSLLFTQLKTTSNNLFKREDTLSVRICNGCQLFMELELINPEHKVQGKMLHNDRHKYESIFTKVTVQENKSVIFSTLFGSKLGVWVSRGEGKFNLPSAAENYNIVAS
jgi:phosphoribosylformylglycinamidine synthase